MHLTPQERDKLLIFVAAEVARARRARGLKLNYPEAVALITSNLLEMARDGRSVAEIMSAGRSILAASDVMDGVPQMLPEIQVEAHAIAKCAVEAEGAVHFEEMEMRTHLHGAVTGVVHFYCLSRPARV